MKLNSLLMFKLVAIILCNNIFYTLIITGFLVFDFIKNNGEKLVRENKDILIGIMIILLNEILAINFTIYNFIFLGIVSSLLRITKDSFFSIYLFFVAIQGGVTFCLKLQEILC